MELIVAFSKNGVIGNNNQIPWHIPEDLIRFKHMTQNNIIIMGRKTYESFTNGPLKDRIHIVLSRNPSETSVLPNVFFVNMENLLETIEPYIKTKTKKVFVIGGKEIYDLLIELCEIVHITVVDMEPEPEGDTKFSYSLDYFLENYTLFYESEKLISKKHNVQYTYYTFNQK
jgi:dihydrofolate reductase